MLLKRVLIAVQPDLENMFAVRSAIPAVVLIEELSELPHMRRAQPAACRSRADFAYAELRRIGRI